MSHDDLIRAVTFGPDQPQRFLTAWLGPPARDAPQPADRDLPAALAHWHRQARRWDLPVLRHNRLLAVREMDGDMLLVSIENQAVWLRALQVAREAERHALIVGGAAGGSDPGIRATRTIKEYGPLFLRHHRVEGNAKERYADTLRLHVIPFLGGCRLAETLLLRLLPCRS